MNRVLMYENETDLAAIISSLQREAAQWKNAQRVGGDVINPKVTTHSDSSYDFTTTTPWQGDGSLIGRTFSVDFRSDHQKDPWGILKLDIFVNDPSVEAISTDPISIVATMNPTVIGQGRILWGFSSVSAPVSSGINIMYVKTYVLATDTGNIILTLED